MSYQTVLATAERVAQADPDNANWQQGLSVAHNKAGDVRVAQGIGPGALGELPGDARLAKTDRGNTDCGIGY